MPDHAILYDDDCGFCKRMLAKVLAGDRDDRLLPVAIQGEEGQRLLADVPASERLDSWHLVEPNGSVRSAGDAAAPLARLLPRWSWTAGAFERFPGLTERGYGLIAANRSRLSKLFVLPLLLVALLVGAGCGSSATEDAVLTVYVSAPAESEGAQRIADGVEQALEEAGGEAGGFEVRVERLGGEVSRLDRITQASAGENARTATEDSSSIAYIGEAAGESTELSVPITNEAGLLQLAPVPVPQKLVRDGEASTAVPTRFQPSGERTLGAVGDDPRDDRGAELVGQVAMELVLEAIEAAPNPLERRSVIDSYLAATDRDSTLGTYTVDQVGQAIFAP